MSAADHAPADCVIVGAGIAGLSAAAELAAAGLRTTILEKSRGVGGRMATRRVGEAVCDHGAQFFTTRTPAFHATAEAGRAAGAARVWCDGFARADAPDGDLAPPGDGHARWAGPRGMTDLPKHLLAALPSGLVTLRRGARAAAVRLAAGGVEVEIAEGEQAAGSVSARGLLLGCPVPQALDLLAPARRALLPDALATLAGVTYDPCFALVLVLDRSSLVPPPGGIQFAAGPLVWVADNHLKGISTRPALTVHAAGDWSRARFDDDQAAVADELERLAARWIGPARVVERSLARWKFATPVTVLPDPLVACSSAPPVACCGDAFAGPRVEGAATSGRAAGRWMAAALVAR